MPDKPLPGQPCNGCGLCCRLEVCHLGVKAFGNVPAPCPALAVRDGISRCELVEAEAMALERGLVEKPLLAQALGIGMGCDSTTAEERKAGYDWR